ncbi:MAG: YhdP family protein [Granulosicoccus sp.]
MLVKAAKTTARSCLFLMGVLLILLAVLTLLARVGLPMASSYKGSIESRVSDYLRSPAEIGKLSLSWEGFGPLLRAQDVAVFESVERQVTLDELLIDLNLAKSLMRGVPVINELTLVGASLAIEADQHGQLRLHGMESVTARSPAKAMQASQSESGVDIVAWLLNARKVGLLDTQVTLIDMRADRRLVMEDLNIRAENQGDVHKLRIDLKLPDELGGSLEAGIDLVGKTDELGSSDGDVYLKADSLQIQMFSELLSLSQILDLDRNLLSHIDTGVSVEMWGQWKDGQLVSARGPVSASSIIDTQRDITVLDELSASLVIEKNSAGSSLAVKDLSLRLGNDAATIDEVQLTAAALDGRTYLSGATAQSAEFPLGLVSRLAGSLLSRIKPARADHLLQADLQGRLLNWTLDVARDAQQPVVSFTGDLDDVAAQSVGAMPGFGPISGRINIVDSIGSISLSAKSMPLPWPAFTDRELDIDSLNAAINIDGTQPNRLLVDTDLALVDDGIDTSTRIKATLLAGQSPHLDIQSRFAAEDVTRLKGWLPRKKLTVGTISWLDRAIEAGSAENGSLLFFGNVADFPFDQGEGVFRASVDVRDGQLAFLRTWPSVSGMDSKLELSGLSLSGRTVGPARMSDFELTQSSFRIDDLTAPILEVAGTANGAFQELVDFGNKGPLKTILQPALNDVTGTGRAEMDIEVRAPLFKKPATLSGQQLTANSEVAAVPISSRSKWLPLSIEGSVFLRDNDLQFGRAQMELSNVVGAVGFDRYGIRINDLRATMLDQRVSIKGQTVGKGSSGETTVSISGALEANDVLAHYGNPMDQFFRGASQWNADISVPHSSDRIVSQGVKLTLTSDLVGTELMLPEPMHKTSAKAQSIEVVAAFYDEPGKQQWRVEYSNELQAHAAVKAGTLYSLLVNVGDKKLDQSVVDSDTAGIRVQGHAPAVAADGWVNSISRFINAGIDQDAQPTQIMPVSSNLTTDSLILGSHSLGAAKLRVNSDPTYLNVVVSNQALQGNLRYPREHWKKDVSLKARLARVDWSVIDALNSESPTQQYADSTSALDPRLLPPIDARIGALTRKELTFKDVVLRAEPDVSGLNVTTLGFAYQTMQLVGRGHWRLVDPQRVNSDLSGQHVTQLNLFLQSDDLGAGLTEVGLKNVISDGQGNVELQVSWPGPAYKPELEQLDGRLKLLLERGNIVPLEPAGGRIIGLFALQALPRRLELDFKDLTDDGLAFKQITGDINIEDGVASTSLIQLTGPVGVVDVSGSSDLNTRQFDQRITVLPRVSAALPIIGAISGGASAGVGALVAAGFLKALGIDFDRIGLRDYSLTGSWDKPVFKPAPRDYGRSQ